MTALLCLPADRGDAVLRRDLVRRREHAAGGDRTPGPEGVRAGLPGDRAGDGRPDPGPAAGTRVRRCRGLVLVLGLLAFWPFARFELGVEEPLIDVRLLATSAQWPVQLTAFLFGMSVLGAQIPLSTFARTDPDGDGLRARRLGGLRVHADRRLRDLAGHRCAAAAGRRPAHRHPRGDARRPACWSRSATACSSRSTTRPAQTLANMAIAGIGSGALVAALPAAAAAAAPADRTGFVTGMTNTTKTIGGAIASSIFAIALVLDRLDRGRRRRAMPRCRATSPCGRSAR